MIFSPNPATCSAPSCQICQVLTDSSSIIVQTISVDQFLAGNEAVPYYTPALKHSQLDCPDLRCVHAHLSQGTCPTNKKKFTTIKRYLQKVTISSDGLLVVRYSEPFQPVHYLLIVPQHVVSGLLMSLHLRTNHPTSHQLKKLFHRFFFALKVDDIIRTVTNSCSQCQALQSIPRELHDQSCTTDSTSPCHNFAADVMCCCRQVIFVLRGYIFFLHHHLSSSQ